MRFLFVDDSSQCRDRYIGIGGVIFADHNLSGVAGRFVAIKKKYDIPEDEEIKWSPDRTSWIFQNLRNKDRIQAYSDFLQLIPRYIGSVIASIGTPYANITDEIKNKIMLQNIENLVERFQMHLQEAGDFGMIIADEQRSRGDNRALLDNFYTMQKVGTRFINLSNIPINLLTGLSHQIPFLQLADLIIGIIVAMVSGKDEFARPFFAIIKPKFLTDKNGNIAGCGLKLFPKKLEERYIILKPEEEKKRKWRRIYL